MSTEKNTYAIIGLSLLGLSTCTELFCLFIIRILSHTTRGGHISTIRMWLHVSAAVEQMSYIIFHLKYHFLNTDFDVQDTCFVLRFISALSSTMTSSWILVIASFYLVLTIKPSKCFTFHSRFLSHCVTWTWTLVSCLMYLILSFLLRDEYSAGFTHSCWNNIPNTIHMYLTYGNELIPFVLAFIFVSCARCRVPFRREMLKFFSQRSKYQVDLKSITSSINRFLILVTLLSVYYISVMFRLCLDGSGSDLILMALQSSKGIIIAILTCFFSNEVISLIRCRDTSKLDTRQGYKTTLVNANGHIENTDNQEMETFTFEPQND